MATGGVKLATTGAGALTVDGTITTKLGVTLQADGAVPSGPERR